LDGSCGVEWAAGGLRLATGENQTDVN
jgi:hypothetical protein